MINMSNFLKVDFSSKINFAYQQNDIAILKELKIINNTLEDWQSIQISMTSSFNFIKNKVWQIEKIAARDEIVIKDRTIDLNLDVLKDLTESINATVTFKLIIGEKETEQLDVPVQVLAKNEWGGIEYIPELLASFVMPNSVGIDSIIREVGILLTENGKDSILNGYDDGNVAKIWDMVSALYTVLSNKTLTYCLPPASFEKNGQKIRFAGDILKNKVGTCLDISLLFASVLEQMGLYPVIVLLKEHAFVGVWLKPTSFGSILVEDAEVVRKRVDLNELLIFEAVVVANPVAPKFTYSKALAEDKIAYGQDENFECLIDVRMARNSKIKPLSFDVNTDFFEQKDSVEVSGKNIFEEAPEMLPDFSDEKKYNDNDIFAELTRLNIWQKKLLNLSPSNPLLNCKISKTNLSILCPNPAKLEDFLAGGVKMSLVAAEKVLKTKIDAELREIRTGEKLWEDLALKALNEKQLLVNCSTDKLASQLTALYRKTKSVMEEGGSNTLYLAIGFLNWKKKDKTDKVYRAPLILCPVRLERASIQSGVKLMAHEDESRFNSTLLQMLKQDFEITIPSLEGELPTDDSGLDVLEIWNRVKLAVKDVEGFEVVQDVVLGHFSFNKYLMWKDLIDRKDDMLKHPLVSALINKELIFPDDEGFVDAKQLDELYEPLDFCAPMPLDSSQLAVLAAADKGKSFVIVGPPGTGKSQTISNLIAHLIAKGKSVLFVSEKMAALEVVYKRLENAGLGRFCLQLHSNKANKKDVLNQLKHSWDNANICNVDIWKIKSDEILKIRNELNKVVKVLHSPSNNGLTPYYAMSVCIKNDEYAKKIEFDWDKTKEHSVDYFLKLKDLVHKLAIQADVCDTLFEHKAFDIILNNSWEPEWQKILINEFSNLKIAAIELAKKAKKFIDLIEIDVDTDDVCIIDALHGLSLLLKDSSLKNVDFALNRNAIEKIECLEDAIKHLTSYISARDLLNCVCPADIWKKVDSVDLLQRWELSNNKWLLPKFIDKCRIKNEIKKAGARGKIVMPEDAKNISELKVQAEFLQGLDKILNDVKVWKLENSSLNDLKTTVELAKKTRQITSKLSTSQDELKKIRESLEFLIIENRELLLQGNIVSDAIADFNEAYNDFCIVREKLKKITLNLNPKDENEKFEKLYSLSELIKVADVLQANEGKIKDWCLWQKLKKLAINENLNSLIFAIENNIIKKKDIETAFETAYCNWCIQVMFSKNEVLREFSSVQHADLIKQFVELDDEFQQLTSKYIQAKLSEKIPNIDSKELSSGWKLIQREAQKQRQIKPIRQILNEASEAVKKLTPCLMMSPLSVAQYLPVAKEAFDVVVFDEASQITVWDAIGTLSRGEQIIVAGDPKQMPPSNFFGRTIEYNEEETGVEEDLESILDELIGSSMPKLSLNWHYRSRCESLIAFSNDKYYEGSLVTFPASTTNQKSVSYRYVENGCYERGARINAIEAQEVVKECVRRLTSSDENIRTKSIGIVTFNSDQQKLIEDCLDKEREGHPEIEFAFNPDNPDAVFVKNLETVQGDERDVILFSTTYGPDSNGKMIMNFGPLNKAGGERRLNVAFTRAKYEMVIFSSMHSDLIDLNRTSSQGVADLKAFLQYAKQGKIYTTSNHASIDEKQKMCFEQEVANQLSSKGWIIHTQVGISSYKIDLAVVNPDNPEQYLAGIECDSVNYYNSATAKDRDKLRHSVLKQLNWKIIKIWSADWYINKKDSIEKLDKQLKEIYKEQSKKIELLSR